METQRAIRTALRNWQTRGAQTPAASISRVRVSILAGVVIATAAASACGGSAAKPQAAATPSSPAASASPSVTSSVPATPLPAGYKWAGSTAEGVMFAVPDTWAAIDLSKISLTQAVHRFWPKGLSSSMMAELKQLSQQHAVYFADLASAVQSPNKFATNGNAFCSPTALAGGQGSSTALKTAMRTQYGAMGAHSIVMRDVTIDGDAGIKATFTLTSGAITLADTQYTVLTKSSRLCYVTLTTDTPSSFAGVFRKIGRTITFT